MTDGCGATKPFASQLLSPSPSLPKILCRKLNLDNKLMMMMNLVDIYAFMGVRMYVYMTMTCTYCGLFSSCCVLGNGKGLISFYPLEDIVTWLDRNMPSGINII